MRCFYSVLQCYNFIYSSSARLTSRADGKCLLINSNFYSTHLCKGGLKFCRYLVFLFYFYPFFFLSSPLYFFFSFPHLPFPSFTSPLFPLYISFFPPLFLTFLLLYFFLFSFFPLGFPHTFSQLLICSYTTLTRLSQNFRTLIYSFIRSFIQPLNSLQKIYISSTKKR